MRMNQTVLFSSDFNQIQNQLNVTLNETFSGLFGFSGEFLYLHFFTFYTKTLRKTVLFLQMWRGCAPSSPSRTWSPGSSGVTRPGLTRGPGRCLFSLPPCRPAGAPSSARCGSSLPLTASEGQRSCVRPAESCVRPAESCVRPHLL